MRYYEILQNPDQDFVQEQLNILLADNRPEVLEELRREADQVRRRWVGDAVHVRGIIEFSNYCIRNCHYCGLNRSNTRVQRYRIPPEEIVEIARGAVAMGFKTIVLQSGDDFYYTREMIADIVREIKATGAAITLSVGERPTEDYQAWREAGADRVELYTEPYAAAWGSVAAPMGGMKASGLGRRHGTEGILRFTESQNVTAQRLIPIAPAFGLSDSGFATALTASLRVLKAIGRS